MFEHSRKGGGGARPSCAAPEVVRTVPQCRERQRATRVGVGDRYGGAGHTGECGNIRPAPLWPRVADPLPASPELLDRASGCPVSHISLPSPPSKPKGKTSPDPARPTEPAQVFREGVECAGYVWSGSEAPHSHLQSKALLPRRALPCGRG